MSQTCEVGEWLAFDGGLEVLVDDLEPFAPTHLDRDHQDGDTYVRFTVCARNTAPRAGKAMRAHRREHPRAPAPSGDLSEAARTRLVEKRSAERVQAMKKARAAVHMEVEARVQLWADDVRAHRTHDADQSILTGLHTTVPRRRTRKATYAFRVPADALDRVRVVIRPSVNDRLQEEAEWTTEIDAPDASLLDESLPRHDEEAEESAAVSAESGDVSEDDDSEGEGEPEQRRTSLRERRQNKRDHRRQQLKSNNGAVL
ncbi:hypothetical protein [Streptomyces beijiangensis]|uniref:Uncharacterized protein n=1 Tax=Streptomyces beijiangensis TaxID=163361 RepID=A0A939FBK2_9ACTN|nr:hypothetical protein [Streptomyces beijiangensis]MBO0515063.1 hypothetical protein [Streptomyces beijiangensis]